MRRGVGAALAVLALAGCSGREEPSAERSGVGGQTPDAAGPIDAAGITDHLRALQDIAERSGGTRAAGTAGDRRTADYLAARLRAAGWRVRFQDVRIPFFEEGGASRVGALRRGSDFAVLAFSPPARIAAARVRPFDTLGCRAAELGRLHRSDLVLLPRGTCTFAVKARAVQQAGGGALAIVDRSALRPFRGSLSRPGAARIPVVALTGAAAARLTRGAGTVPVRVDTVSEQRTARNVLAETPGAAQRVAMAGAHLDSVAEGPGLNDNGSGLAGLLELAERSAGQPGLRLGFWAAEEIGLDGSRHYVGRLSRTERDRIAAYVNLDMIGSPRPRVQVYDTDDRVEELLREAVPGDEGETELGGASDHTPFDRAGIAVGGLFTGASERVDGRPADPCYHRRCDDLDNVDAATAARLAEAARVALPRLRTP